MAINQRPRPEHARQLSQADVASSSVVFSRNTNEDKAIRRPRQVRAWVVVSGAMVVTLGFLLLWVRLVMPWWQGVQDQWQYGSNRITQLDANVGHDGECHYVAQYYRDAIVVIEIPYTHPNDTHTYTIPGLSGGGTTPIVLLSTTKDSRTGRLDLVVQLANTDFETILYNTGSSFAMSEG